MNKVKFDCNSNNSPAYSCDILGDMSGYYYQAANVDDLIEKCNQNTPDIKAPVKELEGSYPVVLYFASETHREEFLAVMAEAMPNAVAKKI